MVVVARFSFVVPQVKSVADFLDRQVRLFVIFINALFNQSYFWGRQQALLITTIRLILKPLC